MEITLHIAWKEYNMIHVDWQDHRCVKQKTDIQIEVHGEGKYDRPTVLDVVVNGVVVATIPAKG